jgi:RNA polymerase sigma-70 factor (ECF subfamily)
MASVYRIDAPRSGSGPPLATDGDDEASLVAAAKADRRAFAPLYRRYVDPVYRYCYRRLGSREAAEDATSLVFARALAALPGCRDESFRSWLFAIAHNVIANDIRAARPQQPLAHVELLVDSAAGPEELAVTREARATVLDVLPHLPADQQRVLELRLAGLSGPEIAAALGRSHGSVRVAQSRAVARLRTLLVGPGENDDG